MPQMLPANISLLKPTKEQLNGIRPTKVLDVFEGGSTNFHESGLFSIESFGRIGTPERDATFSYIDIRVEIIHPYVYENIVSLRRFYKDVIHGKSYAMWDEKEKDLVAADILTGDTGYQFFMQHLPLIKFKQSGSEERRRKIMLVEKAIADDQYTTSKILVMPAGLRDAEVDDEGRVIQAEINDFYRGLIGISNGVLGSNKLTSKVFDTSRTALQRAFNDLFEYLYTMLEGKRGLIAGKWAARDIFNGTRNVIASVTQPTPRLGDPTMLGIQHTAVGLWQVMKGTLPVSIYHILNGWLGHVFAEAPSARLINKETLKSELVRVNNDTLDYWTTPTGITKLIDDYGDSNSRLRVVEIQDHYIGLIYRGPDGTFKIFGDIDELPLDRGFLREHVHPITMCELLYLSGYERWNTLGVIITRFPFTGVRSTYPSLIRTLTTSKSESRRPLDDDWNVIDDPGQIATFYPTFKSNSHFDTLGLYFGMLSGLGGDFDGDKTSANMVYSDEAVNEIHRTLNSPTNYIDASGGLLNSSIIDTVKRVFEVMTGDDV